MERLPTISEVCFFPLRPNERGLIGIASCLFDHQLSLNSISVYTKLDGSGFRLLFPSKVLPNGREVNIFYPVNRQVAEIIEEAIAKKIEELTDEARRKNDGIHSITK